jgi:hypothetical protein
MKKLSYHTRNSHLVKKIDNLFKKEKIWCGKDTNEFCGFCRTKGQDKGQLYFGPTLPLYIGYHWRNANLKILFVGKVIEKSKMSIKSCWVKNRNQAYDWIFDLDYEREKGLKLPFINYIIGTLQYFIDNGLLYNINLEGHKAEAIDYLAMSNLVKCGAGKTRINVRFVQNNFAENCFDKNKLNLFEKELEILKPDVVIFLTSDFYLNQIEQRYFLDGKRNEIPSKIFAGGNYWVSKRKNTIFIASWHPGRKPRAFLQESREVFTQEIKKYLKKD